MYDPARDSWNNNDNNHLRVRGSAGNGSSSNHTVGEEEVAKPADAPPVQGIGEKITTATENEQPGKDSVDSSKKQDPQSNQDPTAAEMSSQGVNGDENEGAPFEKVTEKSAGQLEEHKIGKGHVSKIDSEIKTSDENDGGETKVSSSTTTTTRTGQKSPNKRPIQAGNVGGDRENPNHNEPKDPKPEDIEAPKSPPRKLKKPSSRSSQREREENARKMREELEKKEDPQNRQSQQNDDNVVRSHYNERPEKGVELRKDSPIFALKAFNNFIKSALIQLHTPKNAVVLDMCCGKGGDILKWAKHHCKGLIGVDIANVSVDQAQERYDKLYRKNFWSDFCVGDAFGQRIEDIVHPDAFPVDIVSCQFSMHYAWETEDRARMMLDNVSRALRPGGKFIGTIPNSRFLLDRVGKLPKDEKQWGNKFYTVKFDDIPPSPLESDFGNKYHFFLEDAVGNVPEYIVPFDSFKRLASEYGLKLTYERPFLDMFDDVMDDHRQYSLRKLAERMKVFKRDGTLGVDGDEREACGVYLAFGFVRE